MTHLTPDRLSKLKQDHQVFTKALKLITKKLPETTVLLDKNIGSCNIIQKEFADNSLTATVFYCKDYPYHIDIQNTAQNWGLVIARQPDPDRVAIRPPHFKIYNPQNIA